MPSTIANKDTLSDTTGLPAFQAHNNSNLDNSTVIIICTSPKWAPVVTLGNLIRVSSSILWRDAIIFINYVTELQMSYFA